MKCLPSAIVLLFLLCGSSFATNVLILDGTASPSHQGWMHSLTRALGGHGYNVTLLSCKLFNDPAKNIHGYLLDNMYMEEAADDNQMDFLAMQEMKSWEKLAFFSEFMTLFHPIILTSTGFQAIWNFPSDFKFDLIIHDYLGPFSLLALADRFPEAKLIGASPYPAIEYTNSATDGPGFPSFIPNMYMDDVEETFCSRLESFLIYIMDDLMVRYRWFPDAEKVLKEYNYKTTRSLYEIYKSMSIQLVNYHPVLDFVTPIMPGVIPVGGLQIETPKPLPADLEEVFAKAKKGVILFSLGSNVKSEMLGEKNLNAIIGALAELPDYNIIWKIDLSKLTLEMPKNVFIKSWLPQNDILADKRTKLFISHAGGLSTQESTWYGQPMLALPVMFDQFPNAAKAVKSGMALQLNVRQLDKETLKATILELLNNKKYTEASKLRSQNFQDQPETPIKRALWWVDYILRNDDVSFLKSAKLERMNYFVKHSMDVIVALTLVIVGGLLVIMKIICVICKLRKGAGGCCKKSQNKAKIN